MIHNEKTNNYHIYCKLTVATDSNLKLENLSVDQLDKLRSCFLDIADILEKIATDFENINSSDTVTDEESALHKLTSELICRVRR